LNLDALPLERAGGAAGGLYLDALVRQAKAAQIVEGYRARRLRHGRHLLQQYAQNRNALTNTRFAGADRLIHKNRAFAP
jgi:hypothetical protein